MKKILILIIFLSFISCSFDNKTNIWKNDNRFDEKNDIFKEFKKISVIKNDFSEIIQLKENFVFQLTRVVSNNSWLDIYYGLNNNIENFKYKNRNQLIYKSKKISNQKINENLLFDGNNIITNDLNGNIIIFSIDENEIVSKFNFYKKKFKRIKKKINLIVEDNIVFVADNLGYFYSFNYKTNEILWAKNFKTPFGSNLKIYKNFILVSDQENELYVLQKNNGELLKKIPTEKIVIKSHFQNNISINDNKAVFFLNSYGTLYSFDINSMNIKWFLNLNKSLDYNPSNLFTGNHIINNNNTVIISSNHETFLLDAETGFIKKKFNFSSSLSPIINKDYIFFITKNNFLVSVNLKNNEILYSSDIDSQVSGYLNSKKKKTFIKDFILMNNNFMIYLNNSFFFEFGINGKLIDIKKLPTKIYSNPIIINESLIFTDKKNKINIIN
tara:strand:- start:2612 stop:3937 length:1326 start_codon:yes stop_codon:yes gene_type:complete